MRNGGSAPMLSCPGSCRRKLTFFREQWAPCRPQRVRPVATQADALVLLLKAPICGPEGRARLSRYPIASPSRMSPCSRQMPTPSRTRVKDYRVKALLGTRPRRFVQPSSSGRFLPRAPRLSPHPPLRVACGCHQIKTVATVRELPAFTSPERNNDGSSTMCLARNSFRNLLHI